MWLFTPHFKNLCSASASLLPLVTFHALVIYVCALQAPPCVSPHRVCIVQGCFEGHDCDQNSNLWLFDPMQLHTVRCHLCNFHL
jgi:hypothetical protein